MMVALAGMRDRISKYINEGRFKVKKTFRFDYSYESNDRGGITILPDNVEQDPVKPDNNFNFSEYCHTIVKMIKGSKQKFSVGIYGDWGTGKTTLMKMIDNELRSEIFSWNDRKTVTSLNRFLSTHFGKFNLSWIDRSNWEHIDDQTMKIVDSYNSREVSVILDSKDMTATLMIDSIPVYEFLVEVTADDFVLRENHILTIWFDAWRYEREEDFATVAFSISFNSPPSVISVLKECLPPNAYLSPIC